MKKYIILWKNTYSNPINQGGSFFNKVLGWRPASLFKWDSGTDVLMWILKLIIRADLEYLWGGLESFIDNFEQV